VREVIERLGEFRQVEERTLVSAEEKMVFKLPRQLAD
jgi:4-hydroxy-3-methylbut-2-enyl diphosphate reductase